MVISNRGGSSEAARLIETHAGDYFGDSGLFGTEVAIQARKQLGYGIEVLDQENVAPEHRPLTEGIADLKDRLIELVEIGQHHKVADFFQTRDISLVRFDLGQSLDEASEMALAGEEERMYFDPYPSAIYRLIKLFHPGHVLGSEEETQTTVEHIIEGIQRVRPSQFIRTVENYRQRSVRHTQRFIETAHQVKDYLRKMDSGNFDGILTDPEFVDLNERVNERLSQIPITFQDPLLTNVDSYHAGYYPPIFGDNSNPDVIQVMIIEDVAGGEDPRLVALHELAHAVLSGMRFNIIDSGTPRLKVSGLRPQSEILKNRFTWLDEAYTEILSRYLVARMDGEEVTFDASFLDQQIEAESTYAYKDELITLRDLVQDGVINLTDGLRVYMGYPVIGQEQVNLARFYKQVNARLLSTHHLKLAELNGLYRNTSSEQVPRLLSVTRKLIESASVQEVELDQTEEGRYKVYEFLKTHGFDPDTIALSILTEAGRDFFDADGAELFSLSIKGNPMTPFDWIHMSDEQKTKSVELKRKLVGMFRGISKKKNDPNATE